MFFFFGNLFLLVFSHFLVKISLFCSHITGFLFTGSNSGDLSETSADKFYFYIVLSMINLHCNVEILFSMKNNFNEFITVVHVQILQY